MAVNGVNTSNSLDLAFGVAGFIPGVGWAVAGTYFVANITTEMTTGKNIGQHLDEQFKISNEGSAELLGGMK